METGKINLCFPGQDHQTILREVRQNKQTDGKTIKGKGKQQPLTKTAQDKVSEKMSQPSTCNASAPVAAKLSHNKNKPVHESTNEEDSDDDPGKGLSRGFGEGNDKKNKKKGNKKDGKDRTRRRVNPPHHQDRSSSCHRFRLSSSARSLMSG
jgi:hypothetical protein